MEQKEKKKIGLIGAILMGIGCIVGSGIFGTMPTVAAEYGPAIAYVAALHQRSPADDCGAVCLGIQAVSPRCRCIHLN